jgi:hypothetical protein
VLAATPEWQRWLVLVPVFLIGFGIVAAVAILMGRDLKRSVAESQHKGLIYLGFVVVLIAVAVLTILGVQLPREGG